MYQPSRGVTLRLGHCLRAYQARPQVRAEGEREKRGGGERPSSEQARGAERALRSAQAQSCPTAPCHLCWAVRRRASGWGVPERGAANPGAQRTSVLLGLGWASGVEGGSAVRVRLSLASPRLSVPGGDLKGRGRRGSQRGHGAALELPGPDQTDLRTALSLPLILLPDSSSGGKAGPGGPGLGPCARAGKMATPPGEAVPRGYRRDRTEDQLSPRPLPFPPHWLHSTTSPSSPLLWSLPPPCLPTQLLSRAPPLPLPEVQALNSPWVVLPPGKGKEGPGPELHSGCLDGLRSLFEGPPCPYSGALMPFQAPGTACPSPATPSRDPSMEEHLAVMYERLRQELPNLFLHSHDYTLYSSDVEFINEILNVHTKGRTWYIISLTFCRFLAWNYFAQLQLEVLQLTRHPENWTLQARWRLVGLPIHMLFLRFYKRDKEELYRTYDAYSTFYLNSNGLICRHRLGKLMPSHSPPTPVKKLLVGALVALGLSEPKPSLHLCSET